MAKLNEDMPDPCKVKQNKGTIHSTTMNKQQLIERLVDDLSAMLVSKFGSKEYDEKYRKIVGHDRDPILKLGELQFAAGAIFMGVYFAKCSVENPDIRISSSLRDIIPVADRKINGFSIQGNKMMESCNNLISRGLYLSVIDTIPEWRNSPAAVKKSMAARINTLTILAGILAQSLDNDLGKKIELGAVFNDVFNAFMQKFDAFLDQAYGAYVPPPPPKKSLWASLFG